MTEFVVDDVVRGGMRKCVVWITHAVGTFDLPFDSEEDCRSYFKVADVNELVGKTLVIGIKESGE